MAQTQQTTATTPTQQPNFLPPILPAQSSKQTPEEPAPTATELTNLNSNLTKSAPETNPLQDQVPCPDLPCESSGESGRCLSASRRGSASPEPDQVLLHNRINNNLRNSEDRSGSVDVVEQTTRSADDVLADEIRHADAVNHNNVSGAALTGLQMEEVALQVDDDRQQGQVAPTPDRKYVGDAVCPEDGKAAKVTGRKRRGYRCNQQ